jgi:hypothetical protein
MLALDAETLFTLVYAGLAISVLENFNYVAGE